jgi:hypothetical protein
VGEGRGGRARVVGIGLGAFAFMLSVVHHTFSRLEYTRKMRLARAVRYLQLILEPGPYWWS